MCEIFGFSGSRERKLNTDLREFYSHAPEHPNGWGLALFEPDGIFVKRETVRADRSAYLRERLQEPVVSRNALAHIRLATVGNVEPNNCHPFIGQDESGRQWTLVHNGTIFESEKLNPYVFRQKGDTDSERILLYLIDRMNERIRAQKGALCDEERFAVIDGIVSGSSAKNKLNLLIYDGEILYVHTNFKDSLYERQDDSGTTISTRPLKNGEWRNVPFTTLLGYRGGQRILTGTDHGREYIFDENSYKPLYLAYSEL